MRKTLRRALGLNSDGMCASSSASAHGRNEGLWKVMLEAEGAITSQNTHPRLNATVEGKAGDAVAQPCVNLGSAATTLLDTPDNERLATATVTSREHALDACRVFLQSNSHQRLKNE